MGFTAVNVRQSIAAEVEKRAPEPAKSKTVAEDLFAGSNTENVTYINGRSIKGASPTERAELMKKFMTSTEREAASGAENARRASLSTPKSQTMQTAGEGRPRSGSTDQSVSSQVGKHTSTVAIPNTPASLMPPGKVLVLDREDGGPFKLEMVGRMESMRRGERVLPPCDRCRRLHMDCLKNLTACMGCTKKHAKCSWKDVRPDELDGLEKSIRLELGGEGDATHDDTPSPAIVTEHDRVIEERRPVEEVVSAREAPVPQDTSEEKRLQEGSPKDQSSARALETASLARKSEGPPRPLSTGRFDVRPPPLGQQLLDGSNKRSPTMRTATYSSYSPKESIGGTEQDENDEGDRLQALAAQVYRSASQSVKLQESSS
jgi:hypothetical protein